MASIVFLDESGDHSLSKIDPQYPMFVLCGVLMDEAYHAEVAAPALQDLKLRLFGHDKIILHTADFTRNKSGFEGMREHSFRARFFGELENLFRQLDFKIVACAIRKDMHLKKYGLTAFDPYMLSLSVVIERFVFECGTSGGSIVVEGRDDTLNSALELAFLDLKIRGTQFVPAKKVRNRIHGFGIRDKSENIAGLQIADVAATPIGRHVLGKRTYPSYSKGEDFFGVVADKLRTDYEGNYEGMGLVVLPK